MLLIYSHTITPRLAYIVDFIFEELLGVSYRLTNHQEELEQHEDPIIHYSDTNNKPTAFHIKPVHLLFETTVHSQNITCFTHNGQKAFFETKGADMPFDIFAASFYLLSRYEEYLPHAKDSYGRYAHEDSLAFREGFLQLPLVELWAKQLQGLLQQRFPTLVFSQQSFQFLPTYDIDIAYSFKHKGFWRNLGGGMRSLNSIISRTAVLSGRQHDPFDCYDWLDNLHQQYHLQPVYFFLVAAQNGRYDKNILPHRKALQRLIQKHAATYTIGIHPSWQSGDTPTLLNSEKQQLEKIAGYPITQSRQHYIRFELPLGYAQLLQADITDDYSMGYGSINGFRASVAKSFYWFNLADNEATPLRIHPFCFMDANSFYEQQFSPQQALEELTQYYTVCHHLNTTLCTIWHNNFLGNDKLYAGWREVYEKLIEHIA